MQICVVFSVHDGEVLCLGVHDLQQRKSRGIFQVSQRLQSGMLVILCTTIFNYCNFNVYVYIFI